VYTFVANRISIVVAISPQSGAFCLCVATDFNLRTARAISLQHSKSNQPLTQQEQLIDSCLQQQEQLILDKQVQPAFDKQVKLAFAQQAQPPARAANQPPPSKSSQPSG
jgi:hypothetical protein